MALLRWFVCARVGVVSNTLFLIGGYAYQPETIQAGEDTRL